MGWDWAEACRRYTTMGLIVRFAVPHGCIKESSGGIGKFEIDDVGVA
jgi:hypothetical protein